MTAAVEDDDDESLALADTLSVVDTDVVVVDLRYVQ